MPGESDLRKFAEATELRDTPENRALLSKRAAIIGAEIRARHIRLCSLVSKWQPRGSNPIASDFGGGERRPKRVTIGQFYRTWIERRLPPLVRPSRARD